ncbi:MAG: CBS domain-containing protein [Thermodesulfobacteriota bacterium]|nr:CBS domain-containing protein [Thermodesulfobacteriota bacterium]
MKTNIVKDLMVPLSDYATVSEDSTLYDAIIALEEAQNKFDQSRYRHRAILIYDKNRHITGKVSQLDILRALEPKYDEMGEGRGVSHYGFSKKFIRSLREQFRLFDKPMEEICQKAASLKTKKIMYTPAEGEYVNEDDSMDVGIHRLVMGHHQCLLVTKNDDTKNIIGILRKTDVFMEISKVIKSLNL